MAPSSLTRTAVAGVAALLVLLAGCANVSEEQQIASEACVLYEQLLAGDPETTIDEELVASFEALQQRADEAGMSDADIEAAVEAECPGIFGDLEEFFGQGS